MASRSYINFYFRHQFYHIEETILVCFPIHFCLIESKIHISREEWCVCVCVKYLWFSSVQSLSHVWLIATPWTAALQASLSITNSWSLLKLMSIKPMMPSNHLIPCHPQERLKSFPVSGSFPMSQFFTSGGQIIGASASASLLPMNTLVMNTFQWISLANGTISWNSILNPFLQNINTYRHISLWLYRYQ